MEIEEFKKQVSNNEDTAIKLLKENVELKEKAKLYEILIEDAAWKLKEIQESRGIIITSIDFKEALTIAIEDNMEKMIKMVEEFYNEI